MTIPQVSKSQTTVDNTNGYTHRELHNAVATAVNALEISVAQNAQDITLKQDQLIPANGIEIVGSVISAKDGSDTQKGIVQTDGITTKIVDGKLEASVTASQVGAVAVNTAITGATKTKITYDSKGLVTGGSDLDYTDLPIATSSTVGAVKPDGTRITVDENGIITTTGSGTGDVTGPTGATDNAIARFDDVTGKIIQNSSATIDDSGNIAATNLSGTNTGDQTASDFDIKDLTDSTSLRTTWSGKQDALGFTPENVANKVTSFQATPDDTHYISEKLAKDSLDAKEPNLPATPENPTVKYLNGNRQWSEILIGSGGYAANLYLTTIASTDVSGYKQISYTNDASETIISKTVKANELLIYAYLFEQAAGITTIDAGTWRTSLYAAIDAAAGDSYFKFEVFVRHTGGTETVLFSQYSGTIENRTGYEGYQRITIDSIQPLFTILATDRLGVKIYAKTTAAGDRTLYYKVGDGNASYCNTPLAIRHTQLRGLNDDSNYQHITSSEKSTYAGKQDALVSGTNIKTINSSSVLGSGNLDIIGVDVTTKGDLETHNGTNSTRLAVGSNGQVLVADSTQTTGLKWDTPTGGGADILAVQVFS